MHLDKYRERKAAGFITLVPINEEKILVSSAKFNSLTGKPEGSEESFFTVEEVEAQREQIAREKDEQLAELDAIISDAREALRPLKEAREAAKNLSGAPDKNLNSEVEKANG